MFDRRTYVDETEPAGVCECGEPLRAILKTKSEHLPTGKTQYGISETKLIVNGRRVCSACFMAEKQRRESMAEKQRRESMAEKVFWMSWWIRPIDDPEVASKWPKGVKGWVSGEDANGRQSVCARVEAGSEDAAKAKALSMYGKFRTEVEWRFINEKPAGWWPEPSRFPR